MGWIGLALLVSTAFGGSDRVWPIPPATSTVVSVYDGDTLTLASGDKVRLRWVNTPERKPPEPMAEEAQRFTQAFVAGQEVTLVLGSENPRDSYGRVVAGIRTRDGDLSEHLLREGLGHLFIIPPDETDLSALVAAQAEARAAQRGIWGLEPYQGVLHITSFHANGSGDDYADPNVEYLRVCNMSAETLDVGGFQIKRASGKVWTLPSMLIPAGHTVKILSGQGHDQSDPHRQLEIHLNSTSPIWDDHSDTATILDRFGNVVDSRTHTTGH